MIKQTKLLPFIAAVGLFATGSAQALIIDTFNQPSQSIQTVVTLGAPNDSASDTSTSDIPNIIGGIRQLDMDSNFSGASGGGNGSADVDKFDSNTFVVNNDTNVQSDVMITWDANGAGLGGGAGVDLLEGTGNSAARAFVMDVLSIDANGVSITVDLIDASTGTASGSDTFFAEGQLFVKYSDFTGAGGFDFEHVTSIKLSLVGVGPAWDGEIDLVSSDKVPTSGAPLPGTVALFGLAMVGLGAVRRRRKV